ncbi:SDR family oxidoreductase [Gammaproteobacteria bacterium]|nr:SDR family oxidoreductase [Gammaproteobacteria bacterium]
MKSFLNKTAVITGAGSGMGRYLALLLAKAGCNVAICDINEDALAETSKMVNHYNVACSTHTVDIGDKEEIDALYEQVIQRHKTVDLLFNNAGITVLSNFENMPEKDWDRVINVNFHGVVSLTRKFLSHLSERPEAALVNTSSIFGMITVPNQSVYHAAKFAVRGFTESIAKEFKGTNLQIHSVHPGHIGTNILASAKREESSPDLSLVNIVGKNLSQDEQGKIFRENGMHPSRAAQIILEGVKAKKSRILVGLDAKIMDLSQRLTPTHYQKLWPFLLLPLFVFRRHLRRPISGLPE